MKVICCWIGILVGLWESSAQVGINTVDPKAQLDIVSSDSQSPSNIDGILIPRVDNFPIPQPTSAQEGLLLYLKTPKNNFPIGFYYWSDSPKQWKPVAATPTVPFFKEGTTLPAEGITENIYRTGNIGIGGESPEVRLKVILDEETDHSVRTALEIDNFSSSPSNVTYGILSNNRSITDDKKYGIKNNVGAKGRGIHFGIYNEVYQERAEDIFGIYNKVGRTFGVPNYHYGIYSEIGTPLGTGFVYGIYSTALGNDPKKVYAGYFAGRVAIGSAPEKEYVFPTDRGAPNQILALDGQGSLNWTSPGNYTYTATPTATGNYTIPDNIYTLQVNNSISSITFPQASLHPGRIIVLLGWNGISPKTLKFSSGNDLWDISSASSITTISGGERFIVQSSGTRWVVLSKQ